MRYFALAADYDGTIATHGRVPDDVVAALKRASASGRKLILVTGREIPELIDHFPDLGVFHLVVGENGALLYDPETKQETLLSDPPPEALVHALRERGVADLRVGRSIVATWSPHETTLLEVIKELGIEWHIIFNKGAVMALPSTVNKATGLKAALDAFKLSPHNAVGIGDAENDHAFLAMCECSVAVANALDTVKERADYVTKGDHGSGVIELIEKLIEDDLASLDPCLVGHHVLLGEGEDGEPVHLAPWNISVMFTGSSGGGKSTAAAGFLERLAERAYQYCIIDPEGEYTGFGDAVPLGSKDHIVDPDEVLEVLETPERNLVVSMHGVSLDERPSYFARLLPRLQELRAKIGRPHWIVVDEAHHVMPRDWDPASLTLPQQLSGLLMITVHPDLMSPAALEAVTTLAVVGKTPEASITAFADNLGISAPQPGPVDLAPGEALVWDRRDGSTRRVKVQPAKQQLKRHTRKYAEGDLGPVRSFYFTGPEGKMNIQAQNLMLFSQIGDGVDDDTWNYHLRRHDYSTWFRDQIKDPGLAERVELIENDESLNPPESRARIREAIEEDYTLPASRPSGWESDVAEHQTIENQA